MARISEVYLSTLSSIMKPHGLERCFKALLVLCEHSGKYTQKDLACAIKRDKVSTMRMVDYLSTKGMLVRKQDDSDRRCQILEVTPKALDILPLIKAAIVETNNLLFNDFTPEEKVFFRNGMDKLYARLETLPEPDFIVKAFKRNTTPEKDV